MSHGAHVSSVDALRTFKAKLQRFAEAADKALVESDMEIRRVADWLARACPANWAAELKKREKEVAQAKDDLRRITLTIAEHKPSAVEQKKALKLAQQRAQQARDKIKNAQRWRIEFERASHEYRGQVQHLATTLDSDFPKATALVERLANEIDAYLSVAAPSTEHELERHLAPGQSMAQVLSEEPVVEKRPRAIDVDSCRALRGRLPDEVAREAAEPGSPFSDLPEPVQDASIPDRSWVELVRDLDHGPRPGDLIVYELGALKSDRFFLARIGNPPAGDSGWYAGDVEAPGGRTAVGSITLSRLMRVRPDLSEILRLPAGYVVVMNGFDVERAIDDCDVTRAVWNHAPDEDDSS